MDLPADYFTRRIGGMIADLENADRRTRSRTSTTVSSTTNNKSTSRGAANNNNTALNTTDQASTKNKSNTNRKSLYRAANSKKMALTTNNSNSNSQHTSNNSTKRKSTFSDSSQNNEVARPSNSMSNVTSKLSGDGSARDSIAERATQRRPRSSKSTSSGKDLQAKNSSSSMSSNMQGKKSSSTSRVSKPTSSTSTSSTSRHKKSDGQASQSRDSLLDWNWKEDFRQSTSKSTSRKPSSSQRSVTAPSSSNNSIQSSSQGSRKGSRKKKSKTISLEVLVSNKNGGIKKEVHVRKSAHTVAKSCVDQFSDNAQKQCASLANTERHRDSCGDNKGLHNSISMVCLSATQMDSGDFFSPTSDPHGRLGTIRNVLVEYPTFNIGLATTISNLVTIAKTSGYNCFASAGVRDLPDYGGKGYNKGCKMLQSLRENGAIVVTDGTTVTADNAHEKTVLILHPEMKYNNQDELKTLKIHKNEAIGVQRFDCVHPDCTDAAANGTGGKYCDTHTPEFCTFPYEGWKTRYDEKTELGQSKMVYRNSLNEVSRKWNGKKNSWYGCGAKVSPSSSERFFCPQCTKADNALRE